MKSLEQTRAEHAYAQADGHRKDATFHEVVRSLPAMMQINGLLAAWAFLIAKKEHAVLDALAHHLRTPSLSLDIPNTGTHVATLQHWVGDTGRQPISGTALRLLTDEALAFSGWLKRAAEAYAG